MLNNCLKLSVNTQTPSIYAGAVISHQIEDLSGMALGVVSSSWSSASMQLHGAHHTSLNLECSEWSCGSWLLTLSGVHLRTPERVPSYGHELLDLTLLFPNSHLVLGWRLWFWFVCCCGFLGGSQSSPLVG